MGGSNKSLESIVSMLRIPETEFYIVTLSNYTPNDPYYSVFANRLVHLSGLYKMCVRNTVIRKTLNALKNFGHLDVWNSLYAYEATRLQRRFCFDKVIGFEESYATWFASHFNTYKIAWMHCDYNSYRIASNNLDESKMYARFDKIVCVSQFAARVFIENYPHLCDRVSCIYNLIDVDGVTSASLCAAKEMEGEEKELFTIVSVGRFVGVKQFHLIPSFAKRMIDLVPNLKFRWYIIGAGESALIALCRQQVRNSKLDNHVVLLGAQNNPYPYIRKANLLVCTSQTESWSYVINEAKILHTPVVTLKCGSSEEVVEPDLGLIVDDQELPITLVKLIQNKNDEYTRIKAGVEQYRYNNDSIMQDLIQLFN